MKVVSNLTRLKIVSAQRGPGGGIQLNRTPENITLSDVIRNTENHFPDTDCLIPVDSHDATADTRLRSYLQSAMQTYLDAVGRFTLADVLDPQVEAAKILALQEKAA